MIETRKEKRYYTLKGENDMEEKKTTDLENIILNTNSNNINNIFKDIDQKEFSCYMKDCFEKHNFQQQQVFIQAEISQSYGYKLISGEKHTSQRDLIIKICYVAHFTIEETNRALKLYGMSPLYVKVKRDAYITKAIQDRPGSLTDFNNFLISHKQKPL